ncbi:MAG: hypothetical protein WCE48_02705 [Steroidobacteraceae bacterium]
MNWRRTVAVIVVALQVVGTACSWLWQHVDSSIGVPMWGTGLVLLAPGNFIGYWIVESLLWRRGLSLQWLDVVATFVALVINAIVWYAVIRLVSWVVARRRKPASQ